MRKFLICFGVAVLLILPQRTFTIARPPNQEKKELKKRQKAQRKVVKQQQRAMKKVMEQHGQTSESRERFKHDMKMQREIVQKSQKAETRRQKDNRRSAKQLR